jgi:hypothetical protein
MDDSRQAFSDELSVLKTREQELDGEISFLLGKMGDFADHPQGDASIEIDLEFDRAKEKLGEVKKRIDEIEKLLLN